MDQSATATRTCRILYFGPGGAGKRDNLRQIAESIPPEQQLQVTTEDPSREVAFRMQNTGHGDWTVVLQALDAGMEIYRQSSRSGAPPFDGVVFVARSSAPRLDQSLSSLEALKSFLDTWGSDVTAIPMVLQYNQREQEGCLPVDRLESLLNPWGLLSFPASTAKGEGVKETLKAILSLTISHLIRGVPRQQPTAGDGSGAGESRPRAEAKKREKEPESVPEAAPTPDSDEANLQIESEEQRGVFFEELRPAIVVPVRIPRRLIEKHGSARIVLEVELDDSDSMLS